jgi:hypothetical protein
VDIFVASVTASFITVDEAKGSAVIASRNDSLILYNHGAVASLHAIRASGGKLSQPHKVSVK